MRSEHQLLEEYRRRIDALVDRLKDARRDNASLRAELESARKLLHAAAEQTDRDLELIRSQERLIRRFEGAASYVA